MKIYGGYISAQNLARGIVSTRPEIRMANSLDEAIGAGTIQARKDFPQNKGWSSQYCDLIEVPSGFLLRVK